MILSDKTTVEGIRVVRAEVTEVKTFVYYKDVKLPDDIIELLYELKRCDGFTGAVLIHNSELANMLVNEGIISKTSRGSYVMKCSEATMDVVIAKIEKAM